jgi:hypothetical protein
MTSHLSGPRAGWVVFDGLVIWALYRSGSVRAVKQTDAGPQIR